MLIFLSAIIALAVAPITVHAATAQKFVPAAPCPTCPSPNYVGKNSKLLYWHLSTLVYPLKIWAVFAHRWHSAKDQTRQGQSFQSYYSSVAGEYRLQCGRLLPDVPKVVEARHYPELVSFSHPVSRIFKSFLIPNAQTDVVYSPSEPSYIASMSGDFWGLADDDVGAFLG